MREAISVRMAATSIRTAHISHTFIAWSAFSGTLAALNMESHPGIWRGVAFFPHCLTYVLLFIAIQTAVGLTVENAQASIADITDVAASGV